MFIYKIVDSNFKCKKFFNDLNKTKYSLKVVKKPNILEWKLIALVISGVVYVVSLTCCIGICNICSLKM